VQPKKVQLTLRLEALVAEQHGKAIGIQTINCDHLAALLKKEKTQV